MRVLISPLFARPNKKEVKPNFIAHAFTRGLSVQRDAHATNDNIGKIVTGYLADADDRVWLGCVQVSAQDIRSIRVDDYPMPSFCIYDAALDEDRSHAEIGAAYSIPEADELEFRRKLLSAFGDGAAVIDAQEVRGGEVWNALAPEFRQRQRPKAWAQL